MMNFTEYYSRILERANSPILVKMRLEELKRIEHLLQDPDLQRNIHRREQAVRDQLATLTKHDHATNLLAKMIEASQRD